MFEGIQRFIQNLPIDSSIVTTLPLSEMALANSMDAIEPGQDFEVIVDFRPSTDLNLIQFYDVLETMGTSIQVGEGDGIYRMHIHVPTEKLYTPIDYTRSQGR